MLGIITVLNSLFLGKEIIKEKMEKPAPPNRRFDWGKYWDDINSGIDVNTQLKRREEGYYYTCTPLPQPKYKNHMKQIAWEQYQKDLKECPEYAAYKIKHDCYGGYVFDDTED